MRVRLMDRLLCVLLILGLMLLPAGRCEEAIDADFAPEAAVEAAELGEVDLLAPEIQADEPSDGEAGDDGGAAPEPGAATEPEAPAGPEPMSAAPAEEPPVEEPLVEASESEADPEETAVAAPAPFPTSVTLGVKEQTSLNGQSLSADGQPVNYASSRPRVASVDANGLVVARRRGTAVVTVCRGQTALGTCEVKVLNAPRRVTFPEKSIVISKGQTRAFPASLNKGSAGAIQYSSDNPAVLAVDAAGNLRGMSGGSATLIATAYNGRKATCAVRVLGGPAPSWVKLDRNSAMLRVKDKIQLSAGFDEGRDAVLTWTTSNRRVATVSADGLVTAKRAGQATITVTTHNGLTDTCQLQVFIPPKRVTLNARNLTLRLNEGFQLVARLTKNSVSAISWTSDDPSVATVDDSGLVAAVGEGRATIVVRTENGKTAKCRVTVKAPKPSPIEGVRGRLRCHDESETLKVAISKDSGLMLTYIWVKNPNRQLHKVYGDDWPTRILQAAVDDNRLQNRIVVGFNASPPVNEAYYQDWNKNPNYRHREPSPLMIANGTVLVNDPDKINSGKCLYWVDGKGQLRYSQKVLSDMTREERAALYEDIISSGARNTMIWRPVLVSNYKATNLDSDFLKAYPGPLKKQALCQVDDHNFILVSSTDRGKINYPDFQNYLVGLGVKTAVELDAGGSTSVLWKAKGAGTVKIMTGATRGLSMVMYFTEG